VTELNLPAVDLPPCRPIILLLAFFDGVGPPVSSAKCHGDLGREAVARVLRRRRLASVLRGRRSFACRMRRKLWALQKEGGWIALESPAAAVVVSGEGGSMAKGARGVCVRRRLQLVRRGELLLRLFPKPLRDGAPFRLGCGGGRIRCSSPAGGVSCFRRSRGPETCLHFLFFYGDFVRLCTVSYLVIQVCLIKKKLNISALFPQNPKKWRRLQPQPYPWLQFLAESISSGVAPVPSTRDNSVLPAPTGSPLPL